LGFPAALPANNLPLFYRLFCISFIGTNEAQADVRIVCFLGSRTPLMICNQINIVSTVNLIMKKINWKFAATAKLVIATCAACLFLGATPAKASLAFGKQLLKFDNLAGTGSVPVPDGYGSLNWANFYSLDGVHYGESGYQNGVLSPDNVIFNTSGIPAAIYGSYAFTLNSVYMTAAWYNMEVRVQGYYNGKRVYTFSHTLNTTAPTLVRFPNKFVTEVVFTSSIGSQIAMDNLSVMVWPIPAKPSPLHVDSSPEED
jgi:hypothetical protein